MRLSERIRRRLIYFLAKGDTAVGPGPDIRCSFCAAPESDVDQMVAGPSVFICDRCIRLCGRIVSDGSGSAGKRDNGPDN